jgi:hypothetical protein
MLENLEEGHVDERSDYWYCHKYHTAVNTVYNLTGVKHLEVIQHPGEVIYIPSGWWHVVRNETFTIALTENFGNHPNGDIALYDEFSRWDQISADVWWQWHQLGR